VLQALRIRDFQLLWGARLISSLGSWLLVIAIPAHVFLLTGSVMATGLTVAAEYLPPVVLGPVAGVVADRWDRRHLMLATDLFRAAAVTLMLFAHTRDAVWVVYLALVTESAGIVLFRPAAQAHTPVVVGTGRLLSSANSLNAVTDGTVRLVGGPLGALLLAVAGFDALVWVDAASYLASATAILMTRPRPAPPGQRQATTGRLVADLIDGLRSLRGEPLALALLPVTTTFLLANASLTAILIPFGLRHLGGSEQLGFLLSALGVGFLLGAPLARLLVDRLQPKYVLAASLATTAFAYFLLFHSSSLATALAAAVAIGMAGSIALVTPQTVVQRVLPNSVLGRISAVFFTGEAVATLAGALLGPAIAQTTTLATAATIAAVATLTTGLVCLRLPRLPTVSAAHVLQSGSVPPSTGLPG
jgi:predicted MFS family arabinose efflux permease